LLLDRVTRAERHGDELPDEPFADGESIEPRLAGDDDVILRLAVQLRGPRFPGDGVDLSRCDLHGARIPRREADPERLALIHGQNAPSALEPGGRSRRGKVVQGTEWERAEAGGQRVSPAVVGNPQRALKGDGQCRERRIVQSGGAQSRGAQGGFDLVRRQGQHRERAPRLTENPVILSLSKDLQLFAAGGGAERPFDMRSAPPPPARLSRRLGSTSSG
jgi:hypothetical protein